MDQQQQQQSDQQQQQQLMMQQMMMQQQLMMQQDEMQVAYYNQMMQMQQMMMDPCNQVAKKPNHNHNYQFHQQLPRANNYDDWADIILHLPHLKHINQEIEINKLQHGIYFIMKSANEDDIHKAIKYQSWTSSVKNNQILSAAYKEAQAKGLRVYLFWSVVRSGQFCMAGQLASDLRTDVSLQQWWEDNKYFGSFAIKVLHVKNIKDRMFAEIREESQEGSAVYKLRDTTRITSYNGQQIMTIFNKANKYPCAFTLFAYLDKREDIKMTERANNPTFQIEYQEKSNLYNETNGNPSHFKKKPQGVSGGLYDNPYYHQKKQTNVKEEEKELENRFFIKNKESGNQNKNKQKYKKKKMNVENKNTFQVGGGDVKVVLNQSDSEDEQQIQKNENKSKPVVQETEEQTDINQK